MNENERNALFFARLRKARKVLAAAENAVRKAQQNTKGGEYEREAKLKRAKSNLEHARNLARPIEEAAPLIYREEITALKLSLASLPRR